MPQVGRERQLMGGIFESWPQIILSIGAVLLLIVGLALGSLALAIYSRQSDIRTTNYEGRAVDCRIQLALGVSLGKNCLDPALQPYFNPHEVVVTRAADQATLVIDILCDIAREAETIPHVPPKCAAEKSDGP